MSRLRIESVLQDFDHDWLIVNELMETVVLSLDELLPQIIDSECSRADRRRAMHAARGVVGNWVGSETIEALRELEISFEREGMERQVMAFREIIENISRDIGAARATAGTI